MLQVLDFVVGGGGFVRGFFVGFFGFFVLGFFSNREQPLQQSQQKFRFEKLSSERNCL